MATYIGVRVRIAATVLSSAVVPRKGEPSCTAQSEIQDGDCALATVSSSSLQPQIDSQAWAIERHAVGTMGQHMA
jgi:hypothetical protein